MTDDAIEQGNTENGPQQQNCAWEICCDAAAAQASLLADAKAAGCQTMDEFVVWLFEYHTLAPRAFVEVKRAIGKAARAGRRVVVG